MSPSLLDVNVLVALFWRPHQAHAAAQEWFARHARRGWATCPFTQAGFVRLLSNPAVFSGAPKPAAVVRVLEQNLRHPNHVFWKDDISFVRAIAPFAGFLTGHRQVTDAYLLGLAIRNKGRLVTLDRGLRSLLPEASPDHQHVEILGA